MTKPHDPLLGPVTECLQRGSEGAMLVIVTAQIENCRCGEICTTTLHLLSSYIYTFIPQLHLVLLTATPFTSLEVNLLTFPAAADTYYCS